MRNVILYRLFFVIQTQFITSVVARAVHHGALNSNARSKLILMLCCGADSLRKMSGRDENQLFIGRLPRGSRTSELEDVFYKYGKMTRCDVKQGERQVVRPPFFLLLTI